MSLANKKFAAEDNRLIFSQLQKLLQIKSEIEAKIYDNTISEYPACVVDTEDLYNIASSYIVMYEKLLAKELLEAGYPKTKTTYQ